VEIAEVYDRAEALEVIKRSVKDYERIYGQKPAATMRRPKQRPAARKSRAG
jgi:inorganic pyrophosphatase